MQTKAFIQAWNEVPVLAEIMRILESKTFTDLGSPKKINEPIIGVMSPLVRAMYTFLSTNTKALKEAKASTIMALPIACPGFGLDCISIIDNDADHCPHKSTLLKVKEMHPLAQYQDFVRELMFSLIQDATPDHGKALSGVSLIEHFQIATRNRPEAYPDSYETFQGWEAMSLDGLVAVSIRGTFMEPLVEILETGRFVDVGDPITEGQPVIREMNLLEKAIISRVNVLNEDMIPKAKEYERLLEGDNFIRTSRPKFDLLGGLGAVISEESGFRPKDNNHPDTLRAQQLSEELGKLQKSMQPYHDIIWPIIKMDIDQEKMNGFDGFAICQGFRIVAINEPAEDA